MSGSKTDAEEIRVLDFSSAGSLWLALFTSNPTDDGDMTDEVTDVDYVRMPIVFTTGINPATNTLEIEYPGAADDYVSLITHWGTVDSATLGAGTMRHHADFDDPQQPTTGQKPTVSVGAISLLED